MFKNRHFSFHCSCRTLCLAGWLTASFMGTLGCKQKSEPALDRPSQVESNVAAPAKETVPDLTAEKKQATDERNISNYFAGQLGKNNTLLVLAYQPDIRASYLIRNSRTLLDDQQMVEAKKLALSYDERFLELRRRRAAILEQATDDQNIEEQLMEIRMDIADLIDEVRIRVSREVLTAEQRKTSRREWIETKKRIDQEAERKKRLAEEAK